MRFLLKPYYNYKIKEEIFDFYPLNFNLKRIIICLKPNKFSSYLIRKAKKRNFILRINETWSKGYRVVESYEILEDDFNKLKEINKKRIQQKRDEFFNRKPLAQLILILRYVFKRNKRAKEVGKRFAKGNAYNDKREFLEIALDIAKRIKYSAFKYGWGEDIYAKNYEYVYYFQIGKRQVSFHSNRLYPDVPEFRGKWVGYENEKYPFKLNDVKCFI